MGMMSDAPQKIAGSVAQTDDAARDAGVIGLNPLHALYPHNPAHASPYSPSSRLMLNVQYLDVEAIDDLRDCEPARELLGEPAFQARLEALREAPLVDYSGVWAVKLELLELVYAHFRARHLERGSTRAQQFRAFQAARGEPVSADRNCGRKVTKNSATFGLSAFDRKPCRR